MTRESWERAERLLVVLVSLHTLAVGAVLLFATEWGLRFGGWSTAPIPFFPKQGGAFHLIAAFGYLTEYFRHRTVTLLLFAKGIATVFLGWFVLAGAVPWLVTLSWIGDAGMGAAVWYAHRKAAAA